MMRRGEQRGSVGFVGTGWRWIRERPAGSRAGGGLLVQLGLSRGSEVEARPVRAAAERGKVEQEDMEQSEDAVTAAEQLWQEEDASLAALMPSLAGAGGGDFRLHAESGYAPAVPSFLAAAWSSLRGSGGGSGEGGGTEGGVSWVEPPSSVRMMDEGEEEGAGREGEGDGEGRESLLLSVPDLLQQPMMPLPSVMEPSPPPPKPEFNRNDNFTINVRASPACPALPALALVCR